MNALRKGCSMMVEPHLSGHRLIIGFEKRADAFDAMEQVAAFLKQKRNLGPQGTNQHGEDCLCSWCRERRA